MVQVLEMNFEVQGIRVNISRAHRWKLRPHPKIRQGKKLMVIILDGWGEQIPDEYNAIHVAKTPTLDELKKVELCSFTYGMKKLQQLLF